MSSFTDLLNPSFLIILGIIILVASLLVLYFESKNRDQTHKITSMFSIVSSLAEEVNNLKYILAQKSLQSGGEYVQDKQDNFDEIKNNYQDRNTLISVSDDESEIESDDESEIESDDESSNNIDLESVNSSNSDESDNLKLEETLKNEIKILKIGFENENHNNSEDNLDYDEGDNLDDLDAESISSESSLSYEVAEQLLSLNSETNDKEEDDPINIQSTDLKTISIHLDEDNTNNNIDYKRLSLPKLKNIVTEKGLANDASKLKKNDLLKLLGVE